jgi:hypothetical protein
MINRHSLPGVALAGDQGHPALSPSVLPKPFDHQGTFPTPPRAIYRWFATQQRRDIGRMHFEIVGPIRSAKTIARGSGIRNLKRLKRAYGFGMWRKRKGLAMIKLQDGTLLMAELHWYEASGLGKREFKIKRLMKRL